MIIDPNKKQPEKSSSQTKSAKGKENKRPPLFEEKSVIIGKPQVYLPYESTFTLKSYAVLFNFLRWRHFLVASWNHWLVAKFLTLSHSAAATMTLRCGLAVD